MEQENQKKTMVSNKVVKDFPKKMKKLGFCVDGSMVPEAFLLPEVGGFDGGCTPKRLNMAI